jgi:hypothetical protein
MTFRITRCMIPFCALSVFAITSAFELSSINGLAGWLAGFLLSMYINSNTPTVFLRIIARGKGGGELGRKGIRCRPVLYHHLTCSFKHLGIGLFLLPAMDMAQQDNLTAGFEDLLELIVDGQLDHALLAVVVCRLRGEVE